MGRNRRRRYYGNQSKPVDLGTFLNASEDPDNFVDESSAHVPTRDEIKAHSAQLVERFNNLKELEADDREEHEVDEWNDRAQLSKKMTTNGITARLAQERREENESRAKAALGLVRLQEMLSRPAIADKETRERIALNNRMERERVNTQNGNGALSALAGMFATKPTVDHKGAEQRQKENAAATARRLAEIEKRPKPMSPTLFNNGFVEVPAQKPAAQAEEKKAGWLSYLGL